MEEYLIEFTYSDNSTSKDYLPVMELKKIDFKGNLKSIAFFDLDEDNFIFEAEFINLINRHEFVSMLGNLNESSFIGDLIDLFSSIDHVEINE